MESSRYNIYIEDYPRNGYILITITDAAFWDAHSKLKNKM